MMGNQLRVLLAVVVVGGVAMTGCCKKKFGATGTGSSTSNTAPAASADIDEEMGMSHGHAKVQRGVKCYNRSMRIGQSGSRYLDALRGSEPKKGKVPYVLGVYEDAVKLCDDAKADPDPPIAEFDRTIGPFAESVKSATKLMTEMEEYYRTKKYEVDKFAKAKEMHTQFKAEYEKFKKAQNEFEKALDLAADNVDNEMIAKLATNPTLHYHSKVFMRDAKFLIREVAKDKPSMATFSGLRTKLEASYTTFDNYAKSHGAETSKAFMFSSYKSRADDFIGTVRSATGTTTLREKDADDVMKKYNDMIDASNNVKYRGI